MICCEHIILGANVLASQNFLSPLRIYLISLFIAFILPHPIHSPLQFLFRGWFIKKIMDFIIACVFFLCDMKILVNLFILSLCNSADHNSINAEKLSEMISFKEIKSIKDYSFVTYNASEINPMLLFQNIIFELENKVNTMEAQFFSQI